MEGRLRSVAGRDHGDREEYSCVQSDLILGYGPGATEISRGISGTAEVYGHGVTSNPGILSLNPTFVKVRIVHPSPVLVLRPGLYSDKNFSVETVRERHTGTVWR